MLVQSCYRGVVLTAAVPQQHVADFLMAKSIGLGDLATQILYLATWAILALERRGIL